MQIFSVSTLEGAKSCGAPFCDFDLHKTLGLLLELEASLSADLTFGGARSPLGLDISNFETSSLIL